MNLSSQLGSLLFTHGEPIAIKKLASLCEKETHEIQEALHELKERISAIGLTLLEEGGSVQLASTPENSNLVKKFLKIDPASDLGKASLETLTLIAYLGPIARSKIDHIRGVNSSFIVRSLLVRGLIEKIVDEKNKRTNLYRITFDFLRLLGIEKKEDLPNYAELRGMTEEKMKQETLTQQSL